MAGGGSALSHLDGLELVRVLLPLREPWVSEAGTISHRDSLLVRAVVSGAEGWGECAALPGPTYSAEYTAGALEVARGYLVPALLSAGAASAAELERVLSRVKGHNMAKAAFEMAYLDAELKVAGSSLAEFFAQVSASSQPPRQRVPAGVAVGLATVTGALLDEVGRFVEEGYRRVKLKVLPGAAPAQLRAVRERWPELVLGADANGAYDVLGFDEAVAQVKALEPFGLAFLEQPLAEDDLLGHAELARRVAVPICLDEGLTSRRAVVTALELRACSVVNLKPGRLGGYLEAVRAHDACVERGAAAWCGGMVETGLARAANVALASLPGFSIPGDLSASGRFFAADTAGPLPLGADGTIAVPAGPGLGVEVDAAAIAAFSTWRQWFPAGPGTLRCREPAR
jgi:O-succinylbenzoate synthase